MQAGIVLVLAVYAGVVVALFGGFYFLHRVVADGNYSVFRRTAGVFLKPFYDGRVAVVVIFLGVGFMLFLMAPTYHTITYTTGYQYSIIPVKDTLRYTDQSCSYGLLGDPATGYRLTGGCAPVERYTLDRAVVGLEVVERPVQTTITSVFYRPDYTLGGLFFIVLGLLLAAVFLVRANNRLTHMESVAEDLYLT